MPHNRYFANTPLIPDTPIVIREKEAHHLLRVMRAEVGDTIEVIDGQGSLAICKVTSTDKHLATAIPTQIISEKPPEKSITLALALSKPSNLEWAIEKSVELGVSELWLFPGELSEKKSLSPTQQERLIQITIAATKQSGRLYLPKILYKEALLQWQIPTDYTTLVCDPDPNSPYLFELDLQSAASLLLFIGPEKGLSKHEKQILSSAKTVRLHKNILRAETAPLAALSLLLPFCHPGGSH